MSHRRWRGSGGSLRKQCIFRQVHVKRWFVSASLPDGLHRYRVQIWRKYRIDSCNKMVNRLREFALRGSEDVESRNLGPAFFYLLPLNMQRFTCSRITCQMSRTLLLPHSHFGVNGFCDYIGYCDYLLNPSNQRDNSYIEPNWQTFFRL